jgi:hypothetical protein
MRVGIAEWPIHAVFWLEWDASLGLPPESPSNIAIPLLNS